MVIDWRRNQLGMQKVGDAFIEMTSQAGFQDVQSGVSKHKKSDNSVGLDIRQDTIRNIKTELVTATALAEQKLVTARF